MAAQVIHSSPPGCVFSQEEDTVCTIIVTRSLHATPLGIAPYSDAEGITNNQLSSWTSISLPPLVLAVSVTRRPVVTEGGSAINH